MFKIIVLLILSLFMMACVSTNNDSEQIDTQFHQLGSDITKLEKSLAEQITNTCKLDSKKIAEQVAAAVIAKQSVRPKKTRKSGKANNIERCSDVDNIASVKGKLLMGGVEKVVFVKEKLDIDARIDTGADSSSLGIYQLTRFERDGKKWVKFALNNKEDAVLFEYPVYDAVRIKQQSDEKAERRLEIKMDILIGEKKYRKQVFNLADRSHLEYQALIGRNFLRDIAIVDVSHKHLLGKK